MDDGQALSDQEGPPANRSIRLESSGFAHNSTMPIRFTDDGSDVSPPIMWSGVPANARELALICDDPDAPSPDPWVHWVIYKIPPTRNELPESVPALESPSEISGAVQGLNSWETIGYRGPAPPRGNDAHRYYFTLYALDEILDLRPGLDKYQLLDAMRAHIIARGELIGVYGR
jgi:hypothetical protein